MAGSSSILLYSNSSSSSVEGGWTVAGAVSAVLAYASSSVCASAALAKAWSTRVLALSIAWLIALSTRSYVS